MTETENLLRSAEDSNRSLSEEVQQLRDQLAAEKNVTKVLRSKDNHWRESNTALIKQLAAERERVEGLHEACRAEANHGRQLCAKLADLVRTAKRCGRGLGSAWQEEADAALAKATQD